MTGHVPEIAGHDAEMTGHAPPKYAVCARDVSLHVARTAIQHDWRAAYRKYVEAEPRALPPGTEEEEEVVE